MLAEPAACVVLRLKVTPLALLAFLALLEPWRLLLGLAGAPPHSGQLVQLVHLVQN